MKTLEDYMQAYLTSCEYLPNFEKVKKDVMLFMHEYLNIDDMIKKGVSRLTDSERPAKLDPAKLNDLVLVCGSGDGECVWIHVFLCVLLFGFFTYGLLCRIQINICRNN